MNLIYMIGCAMENTKSFFLYIGITCILIIGTLLLSATHGPLATNALTVLKIILGHLLPNMPWMSDGTITPAQDQAVWDFRLPRILLAIISGAALSLAGMLLQVMVRNPLAEPYILGISSGAGLGAVIAIVAGSTALAGITLNLAAFLGAILTIVLVYFLALHEDRISSARLILAGVAIGSFFAALTNFLIMTTNAQNIYSILHFMLGSVSAAQWNNLLPPLLTLLLASLIAGTRSRALNAMLMGDETATALGINVGNLRKILLALTALLTATTVSVAGGIGFVGLIVPHLCRMLVGADHRKLLPLSILGGGAFLGLCDLLARTLAEPVEIPLGILTATLGAPFFLWIMRKKGIS